MKKLFNKILVPVDFTDTSRNAIDKAIDMAKQFNCSVHLLHVDSFSTTTALSMSEGHLAIAYELAEYNSDVEKKLKEIWNNVRNKTGNSIQIDYSVTKGSWNEGVINFINENNCDLILIGQTESLFRKRKMRLNPDKISAGTNCPVVTIPSNRKLIDLYSIVIPITDFLPVRKLMYGVYISVNYNTTIKLLGIENEHTKGKVQYYLEKAFQLIKENSKVKVEMQTMLSENIAEAVNQFATIEQVGLVIVNPGVQTKMPGLFASVFGNILQKYSASSVLTVKPA